MLLLTQVLQGLHASQVAQAVCEHTHGVHAKRPTCEQHLGARCSLRRCRARIAAQVAEAVRDGLANHTLDVQHLDNLLYARLTLTNPHKVWLSIELLRTVRPAAGLHPAEAQEPQLHRACVQREPARLCSYRACPRGNSQACGAACALQLTAMAQLQLTGGI